MGAEVTVLIAAITLGGARASGAPGSRRVHTRRHLASPGHLRAVLDTNVLFAARISPSGVPARLVWLALERRYELVVSPLLLAEVAEALLRKKAGLGECTVVGDPSEPGRWSREADDYLVGLALAAEADVLVSGDRDVLHLIDPPLPVLTPRKFLDRLRQDA